MSVGTCIGSGVASMRRPGKENRMLGPTHAAAARAVAAGADISSSSPLCSANGLSCKPVVVEDPRKKRLASLNARFAPARTSSPCRGDTGKSSWPKCVSDVDDDDDDDDGSITTKSFAPPPPPPPLPPPPLPSSSHEQIRARVTPHTQAAPTTQVSSPSNASTSSHVCRSHGCSASYGASWLAEADDYSDGDLRKTYNHVKTLHRTHELHRGFMLWWEPYKAVRWHRLKVLSVVFGRLLLLREEAKQSSGALHTLALLFRENKLLERTFGGWSRLAGADRAAVEKAKAQRHQRVTSRTIENWRVMCRRRKRMTRAAREAAGYWQARAMLWGVATLWGSRDAVLRAACERGRWYHKELSMATTLEIWRLRGVLLRRHRVRQAFAEQASRSLRLRSALKIWIKRTKARITHHETVVRGSLCQIAALQEQGLRGWRAWMAGQAVRRSVMGAVHAYATARQSEAAFGAWRQHTYAATKTRLVYQARLRRVAEVTSCRAVLVRWSSAMERAKQGREALQRAFRTSDKRRVHTAWDAWLRLSVLLKGLDTAVRTWERRRCLEALTRWKSYVEAIKRAQQEQEQVKRARVCLHALERVVFCRSWRTWKSYSESRRELAAAIVRLESRQLSAVLHKWKLRTEECKIAKERENRRRANRVRQRTYVAVSTLNHVLVSSSWRRWKRLTAARHAMVPAIRVWEGELRRRVLRHWQLQAAAFKRAQEQQRRLKMMTERAEVALFRINWVQMSVCWRQWTRHGMHSKARLDAVQLLLSKWDRMQKADGLARWRLNVWRAREEQKRRRLRVQAAMKKTREDRQLLRKTFHCLKRWREVKRQMQVVTEHLERRSKAVLCAALRDLRPHLRVKELQKEAAETAQLYHVYHLMYKGYAKLSNLT